VHAREARVTRHTRWSQLVTIDIIRRDTLAAGHTITSPLRGHSAGQAPAPAGNRSEPVTGQPAL
jgi:hypothetical protein